MALLRCDRAAHEDPPLLYLLHGLSDDHTAWTRFTSVERYAAEHGLAVVMPSAGRSFYADERHGHAYWTYVADELPQVVRRFFRVTDDPARTYVAGLSMGGYGALFALLGRAGAGPFPPLHVSCGTDDPLAPQVHAFVAAATDAGLDVTTDFRPGGHEWAVWDRLLPEVLGWLPGLTSA